MHAPSDDSPTGHCLACWEITDEGKPRWDRGDRDVAIEAARRLKSLHLTQPVTVRDFAGGAWRFEILSATLAEATGRSP